MACRQIFRAEPHCCFVTTLDAKLFGNCDNTYPELCSSQLSRQSAQATPHLVRLDVACYHMVRREVLDYATGVNTVGARGALGEAPFCLTRWRD